MKLATLRNGLPDGRLALVSRDLKRALPVPAIAPTLQDALDRWETVSPQLEAHVRALERGPVDGEIPFDPDQAAAPLPRAWQWLDGSAYPAHGKLMTKAFGLQEMDLKGRPLMYQGLSNPFHGGADSMPFPSEADGIDFEGEFGVIVGPVAMGASAKQASAAIRLIVQINDWSLRQLTQIEMRTGFGWVHAKPACSMAPVAVTPDELGSAWRDDRVHLPLKVWWNGALFGAADGGAMEHSFAELVAHAAYSRALCPGTIVGSGTVSNETYRQVGSSCIAERRGIEMMDEGAARTGFMRFGDRVRMEVFGDDGRTVFGAIDQVVVAASKA